jgi:hypothetical protein
MQLPQLLQKLRYAIDEESYDLNVGLLESGGEIHEVGRLMSWAIRLPVNLRHCVHWQVAFLVTGKTMACVAGG